MRFCYWLTLVAAMVCTPALVNAQEAATQEAAPNEQQAPEKPADQVAATEIMQLYRSGDVDAAEARFKEALEAHPNSMMLKNLHSVAYSALMRADRAAEALAHLEISVEQAMQMAARTGNPSQFSTLLNLLVMATKENLGADEAAKTIEKFATKAGEMPEPNSGVTVVIDGQRALQMAEEGKADEARALTAKHADQAKAAADAAAGDANALRVYMTAMKARMNVEDELEEGDSAPLSQELLAYVTQAGKAHPEELGTMYIMEGMTQAAQTSSEDPEVAGKIMEELKTYLDNEGAKVQVSQVLERQMTQVNTMIEQSAKMREALLGQAAKFPEDASAWVNGEPRTPESLKGKVVLLDFFAVWCGPCIMTFPHLKEWHDEYSSQGFEIVGVSNYHQYGWDDEAKRPVSMKEQGLDHAGEEAALEKFVAHYELRHPIAYMDNRELWDYYMVRGIPHMALIDREGKIRMFRVGAGKRNARAIEQAIKECLAESAEGASS